jgi:tetratricopeptide (TPR) repeat protein
VEKLLRYAKWQITPLQFRGLQIFVSIAFFMPAKIHATVFIQLLALVMGPLLVKSLLKRAVEKRFEAFDGDYPVLLLSYVSLLKTGMSAIGGLESAARGLDEDSMVRAEVALLIERGRQLLEQGQLDEAARVLGQAQDLNPTHPDVASALAAVQKHADYRRILAEGDELRKKGLLGDAKRAYRRARETIDTPEVRKRLDDTEDEQMINDARQAIARRNWSVARASLDVAKRIHDTPEVRELIEQVDARDGKDTRNGT